MFNTKCSGEERRLYKHKGFNLTQRDLKSFLAFMPALHAKAIPALLLQINEGGAETKKALMPANINHLCLMFQSVGVS